MEIIGKTIIPLFLAVILTACNGIASAPTTSPTDVMETALAIVKTAVAETQTAIPTVTPTATLLPSATPLPTATPLPPTEIPTTTSSPIPVSGVPTIVVMKNGVTWTECIAPSIDYAHSVEDFQFATNCLHGEIPTWNDQDKKIAGEWIGDNISDADLQQVIGSDVYLVKRDHSDYEFLKNGNVVIKTSAPDITFPPNRNLWNIGGKVVWELVTDPPTIFVDGVDFNQKYQWEGIYKPYSINNRLLYIAKKNDKYHIVYDEKIIGHEFDEIYIKYCCGTTDVWYGSGQYWFWGKRDGTYYIVGIH